MRCDRDVVRTLGLGRAARDDKRQLREFIDLLVREFVEFGCLSKNVRRQGARMKVATYGHDSTLGGVRSDDLNSLCYRPCGGDVIPSEPVDISAKAAASASGYTHMCTTIPASLQALTAPRVSGRGGSEIPASARKVKPCSAASREIPSTSEAGIILWARPMTRRP